MNGHIDFPLSVNMLPYTVRKDNLPVDMSNYIYDLSTVIVHQGTMDSGHYYAYTRIENDKVRSNTSHFPLCVCALLTTYLYSGY
jgi:ubiquitin carboxyl-terminal hydrolase 22/27/51